MALKHYYILAAFLLFISIFIFIKMFSGGTTTAMEKKFNILMIGPAGSGKGTQAKMIVQRCKMFQMSAGDQLRDHRKSNGKYAETINQYIDAGKLVPVEITNEIVAESLEKNVYSSKETLGTIFDGYPRELAQAKFIDSFLANKTEKIDLIINIQIPLNDLIDRLSGRFSCSSCGAIYHKKSKPTKVEGKCDICGGEHFSIRQDDQDIAAIKNRFSIFEKETMEVLNHYTSAGSSVILNIDGNRTPEEISKEIMDNLQKYIKCD